MVSDGTFSRGAFLEAVAASSLLSGTVEQGLASGWTPGRPNETKEGRPGRNNVLKNIKTTAEKAGMKGVGLHTLRHTFASHLVMAGVDPATVQKLLGHSSITTTMIYDHLGPDHLRAAVQKLKFEARPRLPDGAFFGHLDALPNVHTDGTKYHLVAWDHGGGASLLSCHGARGSFRGLRDAV